MDIYEGGCVACLLESPISNDCKGEMTRYTHEELSLPHVENFGAGKLEGGGELLQEPPANLSCCLPLIALMGLSPPVLVAAFCG